MLTLQATLPIFFVIFSGTLMGRLRFFDEQAASQFTRLAFYFIIPITLFVDLAETPIDKIFQWNYLLAYFLSTLLNMSLGFFLSKTIYKQDAPNSIINAMASSHMNTVYLAIPLFLILYNNITPVTGIILAQAFFTIAILLGLEYTVNKDRKNSHFYTALSIVWKTPLITGILLGVLLSATKASLPTLLVDTFNIVKNAASFVALIALGISLSQIKGKLNKSEKSEIAFLTFLKSFLHPILAYLAGRFLFHLDGFVLNSLVLMAAMPCSKNLFIFANRYHIASKRANRLVIITTTLSIITLNTYLLLS